MLEPKRKGVTVLTEQWLSSIKNIAGHVSESLYFMKPLLPQVSY